MPSALVPLLLFVAVCAAAGFDYGGLAAVAPGTTVDPNSYYSLSCPMSELYYTWTVPEPPDQEWYSFTVTAMATPVSAGMCLEIGQAHTIPAMADCKGCANNDAVSVVFPQPGQWFARFTNCEVASQTSPSRIVALSFSAIICSTGFTGPYCNYTMQQSVWDIEVQIPFASGSQPQFIYYKFDTPIGEDIVVAANFYHNISYKPVQPGQAAYTEIAMGSTCLQKPITMANENEGGGFVDVSIASSPDYTAPSVPIGRNVISLAEVVDRSLSPASHDVTIVASAQLCPPGRFGLREKIACALSFNASLLVDPTNANQIITLMGEFTDDDYHTHSGNATHLWKFYNLTLPYGANYVAASTTGGDAVVSLGYRQWSPASGATRFLSPVSAGQWVLSVTSPTNSSFEISIAIEICPSECAQLGYCNVNTSICECNQGSGGPICSRFEELNRESTVQIPAMTWQFYQLGVDRMMDELYVSVIIAADPDTRVNAFLSHTGMFPITVPSTASMLPALFTEANSITIPKPAQIAYVLGVYNPQGESQGYIITSSLWSPTSKPSTHSTTSSSSTGSSGINVVSIFIIVFVGLFFVTLFTAAWVRWSAARGGYVSIA